MKARERDLPMPTPTVTLLIAPDGRVRVSLHGSDGAQVGPPREIDAHLDGRLADFVAAVQEIAQEKLASLKAPAVGGTADGDPAVAVDDAHCEQVR
jgi:hypothetical protein